MDLEYEYIDEICECGERKRISEPFCRHCQKGIIDLFKQLMRDNFNREDLEYLNDVLDGEYIPDYVLGREE